MNVYNIKMKTNKKIHCAKPAMQGFEFDNEVKLEKYYDGRKLRRYLQLLEISDEMSKLNMLFDPEFKVK